MQVRDFFKYSILKGKIKWMSRIPLIGRVPYLHGTSKLQKKPRKRQKTNLTYTWVWGKLWWFIIQIHFPFLRKTPQLTFSFEVSILF